MQLPLIYGHDQKLFDTILTIRNILDGNSGIGTHVWSYRKFDLFKAFVKNLNFFQE